MGGLAFALLAVLQISSLAFDLPSCSPGFSSDSFHFRVGRKRLHSGMRLGKVEFSDCTDRRRFLFSSEDSKFSVQTDGVVTVKRALDLHHGHKDFSVHVWDSEGNKFTVPVRVKNHQYRHENLHQNHHVNHHENLHENHHVNHHENLHQNHHGEGHQPQAEGGHQENHHTETVAPPAAAPAPPADAPADAPAAAAIRHRRETSVIFFPKPTKGLKRKKREWVIPDINFSENHRGPFPQKVSQIRSSDDKDRKIYYSITGPGADQPPIGLFTMDKFSGILYVTQPLDREAKANYTFLAHAVAEGSGQAENPMDIKVIVIDQNDNKPIFTKDTYVGEVAESSPINFEILQVTATDADEEGNYNSLIRYKIINQEPKSPSNDMFTINPINGFIRVNARGLDREKNPKYTVEVEAADTEGTGLTGNTKVILTVTDSNDNAPVYTQTQFSSSIPENKKDAVVVKMQVTDEDDAHTPAWNAKFTIVDGDPNNLFTVATGTNKQEGIITTVKGLDFEMTQTHTLLVAVENEVPFAITLPTATATVVVTVTDVNEAPIFEPVVKMVSKPENLAVDLEVVQYAAYDPDTARKQKVMYRVVSDPAGWLNVAKDTGLVTVKTEMDRESLFVKDDIYTVLIGAYDNDEIPATGTGTLQIKLEDVNDNGPTIEERDFRVCYKEPGPQLLTVTDKDGPGFSAPFRVSLEGSSKNNWTARMNDTKTGIVLLLSTPLDPGFYNVELRVADTQGLDQVNTVQAQVCSCTGSEVMCDGRAASGPPLPIILGVLAGIMLLLMLVLLLLLFARRKKIDQKEPLLQDTDIRDNIYYYDEEGGGEDDQDYDLSVLHRGLDNRPEVFRNDVVPNFMPAPQYRPRPANPDEIGNFIVDNLKAADMDPTAPPYDSLLVFDYEGGGSDAGSMSSLNSCSSGDQDYDCLSEWGPRFKKLADMYGGGDDDDMI